MQFGYFEDSRREYVITTPATPCPGSTTWGARIFSA